MSLQREVYAQSLRDRMRAKAYRCIICVCVPFNTCISLSMSTCLHVFRSVSMFTYVCLDIHVFVCLSICIDGRSVVLWHRASSLAAAAAAAAAEQPAQPAVGGRVAIRRRSCC